MDGRKSDAQNQALRVLDCNCLCAHCLAFSLQLQFHCLCTEILRNIENKNEIAMVSELA